MGYTIGKQSGFSPEEAHVIDHSYAQKYTQPGTGNIMPYLTLELKSEATGGALWHAENQAAGSGTYCVRAMEWLLDQATFSQETGETDTVAFSISATGRLVVLSIHWHSLEDRAYYMSYVKSFMTTDKEHIQACHSTVKNIVEWAVGKRHETLKQTLQTLFPLSDQWTQKRTAAVAEKDDDDSRRLGKSRCSEPIRRPAERSRRSSSFTSTQSSIEGHSAATKDTTVTKSSKTGKVSLRR